MFRKKHSIQIIEHLFRSFVMKISPVKVIQTYLKTKKTIMRNIVIQQLRLALAACNERNGYCTKLLCYYAVVVYKIPV